MLYRAKDLSGYKLGAVDGEIGKVKEFFFDDRYWTVRYIVANTGNWLTGKQVLISPHALASVNSEQERIETKLTKKQIEDSPSLDADKPVSRQYEEEYYRYYGWPGYWHGPYVWGPYPNPYPHPHALGEPGERPESESAEEKWDPNLRSSREVSGYKVGAEDGEVGHVDDFIIDGETWRIRYLVVDTRNWLPGKRVLISPQWVERVSWGEQEVFVSQRRDTIKQAPEYTNDTSITREYETALHRHYEREGYWAREPLPRA